MEIVEVTDDYVEIREGGEVRRYLRLGPLEFVEKLFNTRFDKIASEVKGLQGKVESAYLSKGDGEVPETFEEAFPGLANSLSFTRGIVRKYLTTGEEPPREFEEYMDKLQQVMSWTRLYHQIGGSADEAADKQYLVSEDGGTMRFMNGKMEAGEGPSYYL